MSSTLKFPDGFLWGAATSAYQIEGAHDTDGKGESVWDRFAHTPGKVKNGDTGDVACDHYNRWEEDVAIMRELGLKTYRLSVAWPRVIPGGRGTLNQKGLDFYRRLLDALIAGGIKPLVTLYHWDLPQALQDEGGWTERTTAEALGEYADVVTRELGEGRDEVMWGTVNEPGLSTLFGHLAGMVPPGVMDPSAAFAALHHVMLAHGFAMQAIRANLPKAEAGIVLDMQDILPTDDSSSAYARYRRLDGIMHRWLFDVVFGRGYPDDIRREWLQMGIAQSGALDKIHDGDEQIIAAPLDFLGINHYMSFHAQEAPPQVPFGLSMPQAPAGVETTDTGWPIVPEGIFNVLQRVHHHYRPKAIYITENGCSYTDGPGDDGRVRDARRTSYLQRYLAQVHRAVSAGVPVKGYFAWSLLDNFEWIEGYSSRFGLVWVNFETQERVLKDSARWYKQAIASNGFAAQ